MGLFKRKENNENVSKKGFSIYSFLQTLSIIGDAIVIALFVFGFQGYFKLNATTISVLLVVLVVCFCLNLFLPWIKDCLFSVLWAYCSHGSFVDYCYNFNCQPYY